MGQFCIVPSAAEDLLLDTDADHNGFCQIAHYYDWNFKAKQGIDKKSKVTIQKGFAIRV